MRPSIIDVKQAERDRIADAMAAFLRSGGRVKQYGIGQDVHAFQHAAAGVITEFHIFCAHCVIPLVFLSPNSAFDDAEDFRFRQDQQFFVVDLDGAATVLAENHTVTDLDGHRPHVAVFQHLAGANGQHFTLLGLLASGVWQHDAARRFLFFFKTAHNDTIV